MRNRRDYRLPAIALLTWVQVLITIASAPLGIGLSLVAAVGFLACWPRFGRHVGYRHFVVFWLVSLVGVGATLAHEVLRNPSALGAIDSSGGHQLVVKNENT
ncbi:MAG: hypothetical protein WD400_03045, partial [Pontimonas sp.]